MPEANNDQEEQQPSTRMASDLVSADLKQIT